MRTRCVLLAALLLAVAGGDAIAANTAVFDRPNSARDTYRSVVSVGCAPPNGRTVAYVWHTEAVQKPEGDRIFKELASGDFEDCLSEIARTKQGLYELLTNLGPESGREATVDVMREATEAWAGFGVYDALEEVALTGTRGVKVKALLTTCDDLRREREGAAGAK